MTKEDFLAALRTALSGLSKEDIARNLDYYREMLEDRIEDGATEEEAVAALGPVENIAAQLLPDPPAAPSPSRKSRKISGGEWALLILGFPLWFPLLLTGAAVVLTLFISLWTVVLSLWSVPVGFAGGALGGTVTAVAAFTQGQPWVGVSLLGATLLLAGLSVFTFVGCDRLTRLTGQLCTWLFTQTKRKETAL